MQSDELPYDLVRDHGQVTDAWRESHPAGPSNCSSARDAMNVNGMTVDCESLPEMALRSFKLPCTGC